MKTNFIELEQDWDEHTKRLAELQAPDYLTRRTRAIKITCPERRSELIETYKRIIASIEKEALTA